MSSSLEEQASTSQSSPSLTSPFAGRLDNSSIELLFIELKTSQSDSISRYAIEDSLLKVYTNLAPTSKPYHHLFPGREDDWSIFVKSLFPEKSSVDATYSLEQFKVLAHGWNLPSVLRIPSSTTRSMKKKSYRNGHGNLLRQFLEQLRARFSTNKCRYIFIFVVLCLQVGLALWQFFKFFNDKSARAAFVSKIQASI